MSLTLNIGGDLFRYLLTSTSIVVARPRIRRTTTAVVDEYDAGWKKYRSHLDQAFSVEQWLTIPNVESLEGYYNVDGRLQHIAFDSAGYYRREMLAAISREFPEATSVTEYGAGVGRNLIYLKLANPKLQAYGYELCQPGVDTARAAASKFGFDIAYAQLDYLKDDEARYIHPVSDIAFTMFSLEQLPEGCKEALQHILGHVRLGSLHLEPVPENYPITYRGLLGRLNHWKVGYLAGFDRAVRSMGLKVAKHRVLPSSHNPLMFPSLYVLRK